MIYIQLEDESNRVTSIHYKPFDDKLGMGMSESELLTTGYLVDSIPKADDVIGKVSELRYNVETGTLFYSYVDAPFLSTEEEYQRFLIKQRTPAENFEALKSSNASLEELKNAKMEQLNEACNMAIINGFTHVVAEVEYLFSCSLSAQSNFQGTDALFKDGFIVEAEWTALNTTTGKVSRVVLNQADFNDVKLKVFQHINQNISKFRNELQPQVEAATTNAEVNTIVW